MIPVNFTWKGERVEGHAIGAVVIPKGVITKRRVLKAP